MTVNAGLIVFTASMRRYEANAREVQQRSILLWSSLVLITLLLLWYTSSWALRGMSVLLAFLLVVNASSLSEAVAQWIQRVRAVRGKQAGSLLLRVPSQVQHFLLRGGGSAQWRVHVLAYGCLLVVNLLYASYGLVALGPLSRIDPVLCVCFQLVLLAPVGWMLMYRGRSHLPLGRSRA